MSGTRTLQFSPFPRVVFIVVDKAESYNSFALQSQKAVSAYFTSKQILPFWLCAAE